MSRETRKTLDFTGVRALVSTQERCGTEARLNTDIGATEMMTP